MSNHDLIILTVRAAQLVALVFAVSSTLAIASRVAINYAPKDAVGIPSGLFMGAGWGWAVFIMGWAAA